VRPDVVELDAPSTRTHQFATPNYDLDLLRNYADAGCSPSAMCRRVVLPYCDSNPQTGQIQDLQGLNRHVPARRQILIPATQPSLLGKASTDDAGSTA